MPGNCTPAAAAPPVEGVALDGLLRYRLPEGWLVHPDPSGDSISFSPEPYEGYFTVARGDAARALLAEMGDGAPESASVAGQAADRVSRSPPAASRSDKSLRSTPNEKTSGNWLST